MEEIYKEIREESEKNFEVYLIEIMVNADGYGFYPETNEPGSLAGDFQFGEGKKPITGSQGPGSGCRFLLAADAGFRLASPVHEQGGHCPGGVE
jgi:hypothetical protein